MGFINIYHVKKLYDKFGEFIEHPEYMASVGRWISFWKEFFAVKEIRIMMKGYKTYIVAALMGLVQAARMLGYITPELADQLLKLLGAGAIATVSAKLNRAIKGDVI